MERYEFVTIINEKDGRTFVGVYDDKDLYYDPSKKIFEFKIDDSYSLPKLDQLKEIERKYIIPNVKP